MGSRALIWLGKIRSSYWFSPILMAVIAGSVAIYLGSLQPSSGVTLPVFDFLDQLGAESARLILSTLAGATITIAGVIFSITIVSLNMTSAQFGPGLIEKFLRAGATQIAMGTFLACFVFSLLMLTLLPDLGEHRHGQSVTQLAVLFAVGLGLLSYMVLIYFIHQTSRLLQAKYVVYSLADDALRVIQRVYEAADEAVQCDQFDDLEQPLETECTGYIQTIDRQKLLELAAKCDVRVQLEVKVGQYLLKGQKIARISNDLGVEDKANLLSAITIGPERTITEDPEYAVERITEVAVRSLSPGVNDPYTAVACIDQLARVLNVLGSLVEPDCSIADSSGEVRLRVPPDEFESLIETALNSIRQNAAGQPVVQIRLAEIVKKLMANSSQQKFLAALGKQLECMRESWSEDFVSNSDKERFLSCC